MSERRDPRAACAAGRSCRSRAALAIGRLARATAPRRRVAPQPDRAGDRPSAPAPRATATVARAAARADRRRSSSSRADFPASGPVRVTLGLPEPSADARAAPGAADLAARSPDPRARGRARRRSHRRDDRDRSRLSPARDLSRRDEDHRARRTSRCGAISSSCADAAPRRRRESAASSAAPLASESASPGSGRPSSVPSRFAVDAHAPARAGRRAGVGERALGRASARTFASVQSVLRVVAEQTRRLAHPAARSACRRCPSRSRRTR